MAPMRSCIARRERLGAVRGNGCLGSDGAMGPGREGGCDSAPRGAGGPREGRRDLLAQLGNIRLPAEVAQLLPPRAGQRPGWPAAATGATAVTRPVTFSCGEYGVWSGE
eukprot:8605065-Pyramimonas_sp.AAC.1